MYLLGIDFGTGGCKVTAVDYEGRLVGDASVEYATYHEHPGWSEQEPSDWYAAMCQALAKLAAKGVRLSEVAALALDGSTHNAVLLGRDMRPLRRTIMWTDQRSTGECAWLRREKGDEIFATCYQMPAPTWTLPQLMWLKAHEPEVLEQTAHVLFVKDYVRFLLTGHVATDYIEAQGTLMCDVKWLNSPTGIKWLNGPSGVKELNGPSGVKELNAASPLNLKASGRFNNLKQCDLKASGRFNNLTSYWDSDLVQLSGLKMSAMPEIIRPTDVVGGVTAAASAQTGIPEGTPVVCGTSDSAVEDYGAGAVEPGDLIIKLATAGNVNSMTAAPHPHPKTLTYAHVVPGMWYSVSATNAAALCQRWMRDTFFVKWLNGPSGIKELNSPSGIKELNSPSGIKELNAASPLNLKAAGRFNNLKQCDLTSYEVMDAEAAQSPIGAGGVMFHPYLQGERCPYWDANLRASFTGVSISSSRGDFCRALLEGVAFSLRDCYGTLEEMGLPVSRIFLIGGGAKSALWSEIVCNVFGKPVAVPAPADASFGAALLAGVGTGVFADAKAAVAQCLHIARRIEPVAESVRAYDALYARYKAVHDALAPVYSESK